MEKEEEKKSLDEKHSRPLNPKIEHVNKMKRNGSAVADLEWTEALLGIESVRSAKDAIPKGARRGTLGCLIKFK